MSVGSIIGGGIRLIRTQPQVFAIWTLLYVVVFALFTITVRPLMASVMVAQQQTAANAAMGIKTAPVFPVEAFRDLFGSELILAVLVVIAFAAVVRAVARPTGDRFAYLRIGMDELRLLGLGLLLVVLLFLAELVAILVIGVIVGIAGAVVGKVGVVIVGAILGIALFCAGVYVQVRISLAGAYTVIEGRIALKDAWRATKGRFWTLFGAYLLLGLAFLIVAVVLIAITNPQLLAAYASHNPQAIMAAAQAQYSPRSSGISLGSVARMIVGAVIAVPLYIVFFGAIATAAVEMGGVRASVAAEFE